MRGFPQPDAPLVNPDTGCIERVWLDFLRDQFTHLAGNSSTKAQTLPIVQDQAALALLSDDPEIDLSAIRAALADLATLAALTSDADAPPPDQAALLALALAD